jgi:hypothetical protein
LPILGTASGGLVRGRDSGWPGIAASVACSLLTAALWSADFGYGDLHVKEEGIDLPVVRELPETFRDRDWHSYVTYVQLK